MNILFSHIQKLIEVITTRHALKEMVKEVLQAEKKWHQKEMWIYTKEWRALEIITVGKYTFFLLFKSIFKPCKVKILNHEVYIGVEVKYVTTIAKKASRVEM